MNEANAPVLTTVDKAIRVLQEVVASSGSVGVNQLSRSVKINPTTVYRILATLKAYDLVEQDPSTNRYLAGSGILRLCEPILARLEPRRVARPIMERLARQTKESVNLMVLDGDRGMYVESVEGTQSIRMVVDIGAREFLHCSAVGKAILAHQSDETLDRIIENAGLKKMTENTITDRAAFREHLEAICSRGYAVDDEEGEEGTRCVGAPVFDAAGNVTAGISVSGPAFRLSLETLEALAPGVLEGAAEVSERLGYRRDQDKDRRRST